MGAMKDLSYDIEQLFIDGLNAQQISRELDCPKEIVFQWIADHSIRPFDQWEPTAQNRLIKDIMSDDFSPYQTVNS